MSSMKLRYLRHRGEVWANARLRHILSTNALVAFLCDRSVVEKLVTRSHWLSLVCQRSTLEDLWFYFNSNHHSVTLVSITFGQKNFSHGILLPRYTGFCHSRQCQNLPIRAQIWHWNGTALSSIPLWMFLSLQMQSIIPTSGVLRCLQISPISLFSSLHCVGHTVQLLRFPVIDIHASLHWYDSSETTPIGSRVFIIFGWFRGLPFYAYYCRVELCYVTELKYTWPRILVPRIRPGGLTA